MNYSSGLEYIVGSSYSNNRYSNVSYFSKNIDEGYGFNREHSAISTIQYTKKTQYPKYKNHEQYTATYDTNHSFTPEIFLNSARPKTNFIDDNNEIKNIVDEAFELMMKVRLPDSISINILPLSWSTFVRRPLRRRRFRWWR